MRISDEWLDSGSTYYNEFDPKAAAWLRELIKQGHIAPGDVDERPIQDVRPDELTGYTQCHFFAGIGGWAYALRLAGWPDDRPVWTGSCPCQPFSTAGKGKGVADERHLWPAFHHLIRECGPGVVFGEQVASKAGREWWRVVQTDLEADGYAAAGFDIGAAGVGAPHIRQRLWWVGHTEQPGLQNQQWNAGILCGEIDAEQGQALERAGAPVGGVADSTGERYDRWRASQASDEPREVQQPERFCDVGERPSPLHGPWRDADWLLCRDGKWRPVEPLAKRLAHGLSYGLDDLRMECDGENEDGKKSQDHARENMQRVRCEDVSPEDQRPSGGLNGVQKPRLLQPSMYGERVRGGNEGAEREEQQKAIGEGFRGEMQPVREESPSCPPCGPRPDEQHSKQPGEPLRFMSQEGTPPPGSHPLAVGVNHRVGLLRGYGNAIVPQVAAEMIMAFMAYETAVLMDIHGEVVQRRTN